MHLRCVLTLAAVLLAGTARAQDQKIIRSLSAEQLEAMLKTFNIEYKKVKSKVEGNFLYDYKKNNYNLRVYLFKGKDLMVDAELNAAALEKINDWNINAKFSRASLHKDDKGSFSVLEWNLDLVGGVTEETVRHFLNTFDDEVRAFSDFLDKKGGAVAKNVEPKEEKTYKEVSSELVEKVLKDAGLDFKKTEMTDNPGQFIYELTGKDQKLRLHNWGKDLMIDARFKKIGLEKVNKWNTQRNFVRAVDYKVKNQEFTALEANLDCAGGVSEGILRYFVTVFDEEVRAFAKFIDAE